VPGGDKGGEVVGINQVVWNPHDPVTGETNTLHVWSNDLLDQHTRYALIVTNGVKDMNGQPVQASEDFTRFRHDLNFGQTQDPSLKEYRKDLIDASAAAAQVGVPESDIVTASVFTTESATAVLEKIRDQIHAATPGPLNGNLTADFNLLGPDTSPTVFSPNDVKGITFNEQTKVKGLLTPVDITSYTNLNVPGGFSDVSEIAFGKYLSPDYEVHPGEYIPR
jgi:hypothetical protein